MKFLIINIITSRDMCDRVTHLQLQLTLSHTTLATTLPLSPQRHANTRWTNGDEGIEERGTSMVKKAQTKSAMTETGPNDVLWAFGTYFSYFLLFLNTN